MPSSPIITEEEWLEAILQRRGVFPEEEKVWKELGLYIASDIITEYGYTPKAECYFKFRMEHIPHDAAIVIRKALIKMVGKLPQEQGQIDNVLDRLGDRDV